MDKAVKVGVRLGAGPESGYAWDVWILELALQDAKFLDEAQYAHVADQVRQLARERDPSHSRLQSVDAVEGYWELREKGGPLGRINVRVFFYMDKRSIGRRRHHAIVILGTIKKENNGPTPAGDRLRMRRRLRKYLAGDYGPLPR